MSLEDFKAERANARANIERAVREKVENWRLGVANEVNRRIAEASATKNENDAAEFGDRTASFSVSPIPNVTEGAKSMSKNTTPTTMPATITKKQLWALFVGHTMRITLSMGPTVEAYKPDDLLRDAGDWGDLQPFSESVADGIEGDDDPAGELARRIVEIENYLDNLKQVHRDFANLADSLLTDSDDDEERYHLPTIADHKEAA